MSGSGEETDLRGVDRKYLVFYLRIFDGMSSRVLGNLVDITEQGLRMIGDGPVTINEEYRLRMRLPTQEGSRKEVVFSATSRWCKQDSNPDFYIAGFQMHDLSKENANLIKTMIKDFGYSK